MTLPICKEWLSPSMMAVSKFFATAYHPWSRSSLLTTTLLSVLMLALLGGRIVNGQYLKQPTNQTVTFGDFVEFECRVSGCDVVLEIFVNGMPNTRLEGLNFDPREHNASVDCVRNEYLAKFWMVVNNRTLNMFKKVSCRSNGVISDTAYISDVIYACDSVVNKSTVYRESQSVTNCSCNQNEPLQCHKNTADRAVFSTINIVSVVLCLLNIVW